ncbi:FUSC family protein [Streptomyces sp. NBC_00047]|uniref:FUSC family protein n=1 Tax=Streptomyces sp. NBC_00047 TaxID=2975627 RepID=UPI002251A2B7|nr:FUSC family protein [Streptomyces sp. NBC_00047]MCX5607850.1 FUSC family protein [Streptomyces sp. NBC_00047]
MSGMSASTWNRVRGERLAPAARLVVCAALPWYVCVWLGTSTAPVAAALPAVLVLREDLFSAPRMALQRLLGVIAGVLLSAVVLHWLPTGSASFLVVLVCGCAGMYLLRHEGSPNQQVLITALMIYATPTPGYPLARLEESAIGIAVVMFLGPLLWPPDPYREAAGGLEAYRSGLRARLELIAATAAGGRAGPAPADPFALWHRPHELSVTLERRTGRTVLLPPRRPAAGAADTLRPRLRLAARTAPALLVLSREVETRSAGPEREGAAPAGPDEAVRAMAPLIETTARALDTALRGEDCAAGLRRARELTEAHRAAHPGRRDTVLRAGVDLTHEALADHLGPSAG